MLGHADIATTQILPRTWDREAAEGGDLEASPRRKLM